MEGFKMSYQSISMNGTKIEHIDKKFYINGVETATGKRRLDYYIALGILNGFCFLLGFIVGSVI